MRLHRFPVLWDRFDLMHSHHARWNRGSRSACAPDVQRYHDSDGPAMRYIFGVDQLKSLDKTIFLRLVECLAVVEPGIRAELVKLGKQRV